MSNSQAASPIIARRDATSVHIFGTFGKPRRESSCSLQARFCWAVKAAEGRDVWHVGVAIAALARRERMARECILYDDELAESLIIELYYLREE
jgi:hypothetical protein